MNNEHWSMNDEEITMLAAMSMRTNLGSFGDRSNFLSFNLHFFA